MAPPGIHIGSNNKRRKNDDDDENKPTMIQPHGFAIKGKNQISDPETVLKVVIRAAEDIDRETKDPLGDKRIYFVAGWVVHEEGFCTPVDWELPNPVWNRDYLIPSGKLNSGNFLHLEVYRTSCKSDPGTSRGNALVGRVQIRLPKKLYHEESGRYGLVKPRGSADGIIIITMELRKKHRSFGFYC